MTPKTSDSQPVAKKAASKTRTTKATEKAEETPVISLEVPGYKALSEEEMRRDMAEAAIYAQAGALVPSQMRGNAGDMYILMQIAKHLNVPVISVLRGFSFIGDKDVKPTMTAQFMAGLVRNAGHTLREQWDAETSTATAVIIRKDDPQFEHVAVWDEEKARVAGLWESTPTWSSTRRPCSWRAPRAKCAARPSPKSSWGSATFPRSSRARNRPRASWTCASR